MIDYIVQSVVTSVSALEIFVTNNFAVWSLVAIISAFVAFVALLVAIARKAASQNMSLVGDEEEEEFINIALCDTRTGVRTHYHNIGVKPLNCIGYPSKGYPTGLAITLCGAEGYPTLCGAEVGWDMQDQDAQATCLVCNQSLAKMAKESTNES